MGQNNRRYGKVVFYIPEKGMRRKRRKIFVSFFTIEIKKEKEKEGTICKRKPYFFAEEKKNEKGKGGKYLEKDKHIFFAEEKEKEENIWRWKTFG